MPEQLDAIIKALDGKRRLTQKGVEYWMGRDIQEVLGYASWAKFENVINRAKLSCESAGGEPDHHFVHTGKMIQAGKGAEIERRDYFLSRYRTWPIFDTSYRPSNPTTDFQISCIELIPPQVV